MYQIDNATAATTLPAISNPGKPGFFTDGNPATGQAPTIVPAEFLNTLMLEQCNVAVAAGLTPTKGALNQMAQAIQIMAAPFVMDTGSANAYVTPLPVVVQQRGEGQVIRFKAKTTNTGASTLNDGLGVVPLVGGAHQPLQGGEIVAGGDAWAQWNSSVGASGSYILLECTGGALQVSAATQSGHAISIGQADGRYAQKATTLAGYGITDAATSASPTFTGRVTVPEGTLTAPGIAFANDVALDTGFWHIADGVVGVTCNGVEAARFAQGGMQLAGAPTTPTPAAGNNSTQISNTAFVQTAINNLSASVQTSINGLSASVQTSINGLSASVQTSINGLPPSGMVAYFAMSTPPTGWVLCDGSLLKRSSYPSLFAAIGTTFGAGDGSTTFGVPDLRGEFVRGVDNGRGVDAGRALGSSQSATYLRTAASDTRGSDASGPWAVGTAYANADATTLLPAGAKNADGSAFTPPMEDNGIPVTGSTNENPQGYQFIATRPRNVALLACIKI
ncbi:phage tail protein [Chromobacterium amazonense]|uniref:phage tail protein n=1 Tax=Chromobacterium amazonense TaxID=1382803 RepID=UPI00237EDC89|nr:phage tail protein [Chromobacterium amazonense]MDE1715757.1 phage tail protein [Chromobacterium amazonense]